MTRSLATLVGNACTAVRVAEFPRARPNHWGSLLVRILGGSTVEHVMGGSAEVRGFRTDGDGHIVRLVGVGKDGLKPLGSIPVGRGTFTTAFLSAGRVYVRSRLDGYRNPNGDVLPEPGCIGCIDLRK